MRRNDPSVWQRLPSRAESSTNTLLVPGISAQSQGTLSHQLVANNQTSGAENVGNLALGYFRLSAVAGETCAEEDDGIGSIAVPEAG
jgi:hypothetical protein